MDESKQKSCRLVRRLVFLIRQLCVHSFGIGFCMCRSSCQMENILTVCRYSEIINSVNDAEAMVPESKR